MGQRVLLATLFTAFTAAVGWTASQSIPAGTVLNCKLSQPVSTKLDSQGQGFSATISEPLVINGVQVIPYGATINGRISSLQTPGRILGRATMVLRPENIALPDGRTYPLSAVLVTVYGAPGAAVVNAEGMLQGPGGHWGQVKEVGLGMGGGGLLGTILGGAHGAVLGLAIGGAAGFVDRVRRGVPNLSLPAGAELKFQLSQALAISTANVTEYNRRSASR